MDTLTRRSRVLRTRRRAGGSASAAADAPIVDRSPEPMPKVPQPRPKPGTISPWAYVLTDYAWNRRAPNERPRTAGQIATRIGQRRQTVYSWFEGTTPDVHTLFAVMAQLGIPVERLAAGYTQAGMPFPPLTEAEAEVEAEAAPRATAAAAQARPNTTAAPPATLATLAAPAASQLRPPTPTPTATPGTPTPGTPDAWDSMIAATVASLREAGIPESAIAATVEHIRASQQGHSQPPQIAAHITAEHDPQPQLQQDQQAPPQREEAQRRQNS